MPQKSSAHMRTWGTRFDTLPTSPPVSPPAHEAMTSEESAAPQTEPVLLKKKEEKMPHDASVFVGSLPSTVDQTELTRLLSEHLSEHTEVKNIKVVRDSKGGVCAFVQCEDAISAASLIHTLHSSPPKYFLGRMLRYEPARAFRTLLVSYRTPMQYIPTISVNTPSAAETHQTQGNQAVELELPYAMRVWRPRNSKFLSLLYNAEAVNAENHGNDQPFPSENASLFLQPVAFDEDTVRSLAAYFGRLERFSPYQIDEGTDGSERENIGENWKLYPAPHDATRSPSMDTRCWEIKWDHRDDCVSALMTLRRVPHLTVTWAHQPAPFGLDQRSPHPGNQFPHHNVAYPLHVQDGRSPITPLADSIRTAGPKAHKATITGPNIPVGGIPDPSTTTAIGDKVAEPPRSYQGSPQPSRNLPLFDVRDEPSPVRVEWSDMDFPPLGDVRGERRTEYGVWGEKRPCDSDAGGSPSVSLSHLTISGAESDSFGTFNKTPERALEDREGQELDMPPTPGLGKSPITPKTPGSQFPITPTSANTDLQRLSFKEYEGKEHGYYNGSNQAERELDPTTLFVGGLETFGPGAWDEEKVTKFFSRFGGLESVKLVRPLNSHAAFAFVKFDNTESPARAVSEEHNRVYEGRAMRVQLRDCNPPRGPWRQSRARGTFYNSHFNRPQRRFPENFEGTDDKLALQGGNDRDTSGSVGSEAFTSYLALAGGAAEGEDPVPGADPNAPTVKLEHESSDNFQTRDASPDTPEPSVAALEIPSQPSHYREWYDEPIPAVVTPPPSSFGSSASAPVSTSALPYSMSNGYYAPTPWMHPYPQQVQYPMPYFGYPGYPMPGQQVPVQISQTFASPAGSETSGPGGAPVQTQWPGIYGSYMPYPTQPARTPALDQSQPQHLNSRAPLVPTGFIQNEQGTLIAVYQPEALDQYMAGNHGAPPTSQTQAQAVSSWSQYPQPQLHGFPFPGPPPTVVLPSRPSLPSTVHMGWLPNQGYTPQAPPPPPHAPNAPNPGLGYRGGYNDMGRQPGTPSFRRQSNRRDQHNTYNNPGRNQSRSFASRNSRGNMNNAGYSSNGDGHLRLSQSQFNQNSGEWN